MWCRVALPLQDTHPVLEFHSWGCGPHCLPSAQPWGPGWGHHPQDKGWPLWGRRKTRSPAGQSTGPFCAPRSPGELHPLGSHGVEPTTLGWSSGVLSRGPAKQQHWDNPSIHLLPCQTKAINALLPGGKAGKVSVAQILDLEDPWALAKSRIHLKIKAIVSIYGTQTPCVPAPWGVSLAICLVYSWEAAVIVPFGRGDQRSEVAWPRCLLAGVLAASAQLCGSTPAGPLPCTCVPPSLRPCGIIWHVGLDRHQQVAGCAWVPSVLTVRAGPRGHRPAAHTQGSQAPLEPQQLEGLGCGFWFVYTPFYIRENLSQLSHVVTEGSLLWNVTSVRNIIMREHMLQMTQGLQRIWKDVIFFFRATF